MTCPSFRTILRASFVASAAVQLSSCASTSYTSYVSMDDRECLARVMYFESLRSSDDGMLAVGTVVMNRLESGRYPNSVCGVIAQRNQFAPGALTRSMDGRGAALARKVAASVLAGQRHPGLAKNVMFFHTYGYHYPYSNMRYVLVAGGNIFYYKDNSRYAAAGELAASQMLAYAPQSAPQVPQPKAAATDAPAQIAANDRPSDAPVPRAQPQPERAAAPTPSADYEPQPTVTADPSPPPAPGEPQVATEPQPPAEDAARQSAAPTVD